MNTRKIRLQMLLALDFEQTDSALIANIKNAIRSASDVDLTAAFEASKADRSFASAIRDAARAGGASDADVTALVAILAAQGVC